MCPLLQMAATRPVDFKPLLLFFFKKYFQTYLLFLFFVCLFCPEPNCLTNCPLGTLALPASRRKCFLPSFHTVWRGCHAAQGGPRVHLQGPMAGPDGTTCPPGY